MRQLAASLPIEAQLEDVAQARGSMQNLLDCKNDAFVPRGSLAQLWARPGVKLPWTCRCRLNTNALAKELDANLS